MRRNLIILIINKSSNYDKNKDDLKIISEAFAYISEEELHILKDLLQKTFAPLGVWRPINRYVQYEGENKKIEWNIAFSLYLLTEQTLEFQKALKF